MAQLIFAQAKSIRNKVKRAIANERQLRPLRDIDDDIDTAAITNHVIEFERTEFREILRIAAMLHEDYRDTLGKATTNWYFITVRPKPGITFEEFYGKVAKYVNRAFMEDYYLSFEQKSTDGSGDGFHIHIVADTRHRSKKECLRDTCSTFNAVCDANCIEVKTTRNPQDIVNNYLVEYKSDDDHKIITKTGDAIWRSTKNLKALYHNDLPEQPEALSSSPETAPFMYTKTTISFE